MGDNNKRSFTQNTFSIMEDLTTEQIAQRIIDAFDSVNLIKLNEEDENTIQRNIDHLAIMMNYEWFSSNLTKEEKEEINTLVNG